MPKDDHPSREGQPIVGPPTTAAQDQYKAAIMEQILRGLCISVAKQLKDRTGTDGPWILHGDGTVTRPKEPYDC